MSGLLALIWAFGSIAAIIFIVRPRPEWAILANRKRATGAFFAVFLGFPIIGAVINGSSSGAMSASTSAKPKNPEEMAAENKADEEKREADALDDMRKNPTTYLTLTGDTAWKDGFDTIFMLSGTINNSGKVTYKDPVIECEYYSETDTRLGRVKDTLYKELPPGKPVTFSELNMGFANSNWHKYSCRIRGATPL